MCILIIIAAKTAETVNGCLLLFCFANRMHNIIYIFCKALSAKTADMFAVDMLCIIAIFNIIFGFFDELIKNSVALHPIMSVLVSEAALSCTLS